MEIQAIFSRVSFLFEKSLAIWLSLWAIRYKAQWDYKLSATAKTVRWTVVGVGYFLAAGLPGPAAVRITAGFAGICFLCWPNLAYHLTNLFIAWPTTEGRVISAVQEGSCSIVAYNFEVGRGTFGGSSTLKSRDCMQYSEDQRVTEAYDPLNPDQSKILPELR